MSFLAPLFLLGAAAIALPVIFHLIRRSSRERLPFSSLMFLLPTPPRVTRRSRLENILLLLLRCAVIALLAFAFARPYLSKPVAADPGANAGQKIVVLLDTSASMRRQGLWPEAVAKASAAVNGASAADQVAFVTFDHEIRTLMNFEQWSLMPSAERGAMLSKQIGEVKPGWGSTRLGAALINACELFDSVDKDELGQRRIVLVTDLQEGSRLDGLQGFEWPNRIHVQIEAVGTKRTSNAGLHLAASSSSGDIAPAAANESGVRVRISNASNSKREQFQVGWGRADQQGFLGPTMDAYIPPGQSRILTLPGLTNEPAADRIVLSGDDDEFDNSIFVLPPKAERSKILFLGSDREADSAQSLFYLRRAFQETRSLAVEVVARSPATPLSEADLTEASLVVVNDVLPEQQIAAVRNYLSQDKAVLVALSQLPIAATLAEILGEPGLAADEVAGPSYAMLAQIDFTHPLFAPFADPRYSDFTKIHFWKHRRVSLDKVENARLLARFDNGDPALAEIPIGKGRVWVLTSGWHPDDSQLALSSKFVPLLYAMLEQGGGLKDERTQYTVGEVVPIPSGATPVTVRKPTASEVQVSESQRFSATDQLGVYMITSTQPPTKFAVNLAPEESRTAPLPIEDLERLGMPVAQEVNTSPQQAQQRLVHLHSTQLESRQKLWRWLIVAALVVLVMETWLAGRLTRRPAVVAAET